MEFYNARRRLQAVQRILSPSDDHDFLLVLPDDKHVHLKSDDNTILIDNIPICRYQINTDEQLSLVISAIGTEYEHKPIKHVPKFPLVSLVPLSTEELSIPDLWAVVYALFVRHHDQETIPIRLWPSPSLLESYLLNSLLARRAHSSPPLASHRLPSSSSSSPDVLFLSRASFWQGAGTTGYHTRGWLSSNPLPSLIPPPAVQSFTRTELVIASHPLRPSKPGPGQVLYKRYCPTVGQTFSVVYLDLDRHVHPFWRWMNDRRVSSGWAQEGSVDEQRAYLEKMHDDPNVVPGVMCWDGELMGYVEFVWSKENHISQYIPEGAGDYDRGVHVLCGEEKFRGFTRSETWMRCLFHYLYLSDPRTNRLWGEPKADNPAIIKTSAGAMQHVHSIFDFPYKRSALLYATRDRFFKVDIL